MQDKDVSRLVIDEQYLYDSLGFAYKLPTGIVTFDIALGGGFPLNGSIVEIWGEESSGKTTLSYRVCKRCTENGGYVTWIDSEISYDESWASIQGLNTERVIPYRPPYMEKANEIIIDDIKKYKETYLPWLINTKWKPSRDEAEAAGVGVTQVEEVKAHMKLAAPPHIIVWDSLAAAPVKSIVEEGAAYSEGMAYRARLIKSFLSRYMVHVEGCDKLSLILINQVIENIGDMYGPAISTPGGRGLRHAKHLSIYVKKAGSGEKDAENFKITDYVMLSLVKNKITSVISSFPVIFSKSKGFIGATSVLEYLMNIKWFKDAGAWKKFDYVKVDKQTGEIISSEEMSIQRGTFYNLIEKRPDILEYLCEQIKTLIVSKFPANRSLQDTDIKLVVEACMGEAHAVPDEVELESMIGK